MTDELWRWQLAITSILVYSLLCVMVWWRYKKVVVDHLVSPRTWLVAYASQTGQAQDLAEQSAHTLASAGLNVQLIPLNQLTPALLQQSERVLWVVSTYGEGDAPDMAQAFITQTLSKTLDLSHLHYAVLALGSRYYEQFCAFGLTIDNWLQTQGATACFKCVEVDNQDPLAIEQWRRQLVHLAGTDDTPDWIATDFDTYTLQRCELLNPQSQGAPVYYVTLATSEATNTTWQAGDLAQVAILNETPRDYTIVSLAHEQNITLLVRLHYRSTGEQGAASSLLTQSALGTKISIRIRQHSSFHIAQNQYKPLILIVSGTGLAGALAHLRQRALQTPLAPCWLIFGERQREHDFLCQAEIMQHHTNGVISRLDVVFSRDGHALRYVQEVLLAQRHTLKKLLAQEAAIYVCGSLQGMGQGVDTALKSILGAEALMQLQAQGRYCRDVY